MAGGAFPSLTAGGGPVGLGSGDRCSDGPLSLLAESRPHGDVLRSREIRLVPVAELRGLRGGCSSAGGG